MSTATDILPLTETVAPANEAEVIAVLHRAHRAKTPVYPIGGGTALGYGLRPRRPGLGLSTAGLNHVIEHSADDLTITVEAGLTIAALAKTLTAQRQWLPIDASQAGRATIGGLVATNAQGPRRYAYGSIRDYLLGARAVDGRGVVFASGGKVVKNVAGYNIPRMLAGSFGTLGVITQVTLLVRPLPQCSAMVICDVREFEGVECLLAALSRSQTFPMAIELLSGPARPGCPMAPMADGAAARLVVGFDGSEAEVQWMVGRLLEEWRAAGAAALTTVSGSSVESLWKWLSDVPAQFQINVLPSAVARLAEEIAQRVPDVAIHAHAGNGVVRIQHDAAAADADAFVALLRRVLRPAAVALGGKLVVLGYPADATLEGADIWGPPSDGISVMRSIHQRYDPAGILNPGRFIFGS